MTKRMTWAAAMLMATFATNAQANVRYDFTAFSSFPAGEYGTITGSFSYLAPGFITTYANPPFAALVFCSITSSTSRPIGCGDQIFEPESSFDAINFVGTDGVSANSAFSVRYAFASGAFAAAGTYDTVLFGNSQAGRLVVTDLGTPAVPEPAAWATMILGFGVVGTGLRARRRRAALRLAALS